MSYAVAPTPTRTSGRRTAQRAATGVVAALGFLALPSVGIDFRCPVHAATGLWCPGCGGTRAARALIRCDVPAALDAHPLAVAALPLVLLLVVSPPLVRRALRQAQRFPTHLFGLVAIFAIARNLPLPAAHFIAPP